MSTNFGTKLQLGTGSPIATYADVGKILKIEIPELKIDAIETTNHASTYREYESSKLKGLSEFKITLLADTNFAMLTDAIAGAPLKLKILFSNAVEWSFSGIITSLKVNEADAQSPEALSSEVTIQPSGDIVLTGV